MPSRPRYIPTQAEPICAQTGGGRMAEWIMTDRRCCCGGPLWRTIKHTDLGAVILLGCPSCDRMRCTKCDTPTGKLFERVPVCEWCGAKLDKRT